MKLASGFCIPEPLPVHTGIKGRQVHPLIRFLLRSRVDEKCADLHKPFISYLFLVDVTVQSAESLSTAIPLGTSTKRANSKRANQGRRVFFKIPCPRITDTIRCLQYLGFQHAEDAFVDDTCACCGRMSMTSLRSRLSFLKGLKEISTLLNHSAPKQKSNEWMHLSPFYIRMHGECLRYAKSTSQFHCRFLLKSEMIGDSR